MGRHGVPTSLIAISAGTQVTDTTTLLLLGTLTYEITVHSNVVSRRLVDLLV